jgi:hypothetical protein
LTSSSFGAGFPASGEILMGWILAPLASEESGHTRSRMPVAAQCVPLVAPAFPDGCRRADALRTEGDHCRIDLKATSPLTAGAAIVW